MRSSDWTPFGPYGVAVDQGRPTPRAAGELGPITNVRTDAKVRAGFIVAPFDRPDRAAAPTTGSLFHACCRFCRDWEKGTCRLAVFRVVIWPSEPFMDFRLYRSPPT